MTHGHELWGGMWEGGSGQDGLDEGGEWENCISIINKIYLKNLGHKDKHKLKISGSSKLYPHICDELIYDRGS